MTQETNTSGALGQFGHDQEVAGALSLSVRSGTENGPAID
jgi:hypothetical protein